MLAENSEEETFIKRGKSKISQFKVVADKLAQRSILKLALCEKKMESLVFSSFLPLLSPPSVSKHVIYPKIQI